MDRGAWQVIVHRVKKSQAQLKLLSMHARFLESDTPKNHEKERKRMTKVI